MNELAQKVYDLLMTEPEWFDMLGHETCILGALYRVQYDSAPNIQLGRWIGSGEGGSLLGVEDSFSLFISWKGKGETRKNAKFHAEQLRLACEANSRKGDHNETNNDGKDGNDGRA